jgi:hypothetical protein
MGICHWKQTFARGRVRKSKYTDSDRSKEIGKMPRVGGPTQSHHKNFI